MSIVSLIVNFVPIILAIILHELAHGYAAYRLGDNTAKIYGRLTLNPLKHIEPFGSILLPALLYFSHTGFMFGWAKPVPVNFNNFKHSKRDLIIVSAAGIVTNLALAIISALLLKAISFLPQSTAQGILGLLLLNMVVFNVVLAIFNALPIPPLDGSKILFGWVNKPWAQRYVNSEKAGLVAIVLLAFILPSIGQSLGFNLNIFGMILLKSAKFLLSFLL